MIINVVGIGQGFEKDFRWEFLFDLLDGAKEAGYEWRCINWLECEDDCLAGGAGNLYLDMEPTVKDLPYTRIDAGASEEVVIDKIQTFAEWIEDPSIFPVETEPKEEECPFFGDIDPYQDLTDLGSDVSLEELNSLKVDSFKIEVQGKEISFSKEDIVTLVKLQNLMEKYNYKITKVIT